MALSNLEKQLMAGGILRPLSKAIAETSIHQFTSLDPAAVGGRPTAANFGKGTCQVGNIIYKSDGNTWDGSAGDKFLWSEKPIAVGNGGRFITITDIGRRGSVWLSDNEKWVRTTIEPATVDISNDYPDVMHVILHGQSLGEGDQSLPIITTADTGYGNYQFTRGIQTWNTADNAITPQNRAAADFTFTPITGNSAFAGVGETTLPAICDSLKNGILGKTTNNIATSKPHLLGSYGARGGTSLVELSSEDTGRTDVRDTNAAPGGFWLTMLDDVARAKAKASELGLSYAVAGMSWMQGEHDSTRKIYEWEAARIPSDFNTTYKTKFKAMVDELQTSVKAISGQTYRIPLFTYQTNYITGNAQLDASIEHADIYMVGAHFMTPSAINSTYMSGGFQVYGDGIHLAADAQRWYGEMVAKVMRKVLYEGIEWEPVRPISATKIDVNHVDVLFHVPVPPLVIDTNFLPKNYGFGLTAWGGTYDAPGTRCDVSAAVVQPDGVTVRLTFSTAIPAGAYLRAGYHNQSVVAKTVASVGDGPNSLGGFPQWTATITGDQMAFIAPYSDNGAFGVTATNMNAVVRKVELIDGNTILTGEVRETRTGGSYRPIAAGDVLTFSQYKSVINIRDSDSEVSRYTFQSDTIWGTKYGTKAGQPYPLWNWCVYFDNFAITGA
jgi:uncharacterized cupin superfamily protein